MPSIFYPTSTGLLIKRDGNPTLIRKTVDDGLASNRCLRVRSDKYVPSRLFVCTSYGISISTDDGETFRSVQLRDFEEESNVVVDADASNTNTIFAITKKDIYVSNDDGDTFLKKRIQFVRTKTDGTKETVSPTKFTSLFTVGALAYIGTDVGLFITEDQGVTFRHALSEVHVGGTAIIDRIDVLPDGKIITVLSDGSIFYEYANTSHTFLPKGETSLLVEKFEARVNEQNAVALSWSIGSYYNANVKFRLRRDGDILIDEYTQNVYIDATVTRAQSYSYTLEAYEADSLLPSSPLVEATVATPNYQQLPAVKSLKLIPIHIIETSGSIMKIQWVKPDILPPSARFEIRKNNTMLTSNLTQNVAEYIDYDVVYGVEYTYEIVIYDSEGNFPTSLGVTQLAGIAKPKLPLPTTFRGELVTRSPLKLNIEFEFTSVPSTNFIITLRRNGLAAETYTTLSGMYEDAEITPEHTYMYEVEIKDISGKYDTVSKEITVTIPTTQDLPTASMLRNVTTDPRQVKIEYGFPKFPVTSIRKTITRKRLFDNSVTTYVIENDASTGVFIDYNLLNAGETYEYSIFCEDINTKSLYTKSKTISLAYLNKEVAPLPEPSSFKVLSLAYNKVTLGFSFTTMPINDYTVELYRGAELIATFIGTKNGIFEDIGVIENTLYSYTLKVRDITQLYSEVSTSISVQVPRAKLPNPTYFRAKEITTDKVVIEYGFVGLPVTDYTVVVKRENIVALTKTNSPTGEYTHEGLSGGMSYRYSVVVYDNSGQWLPSDETPLLVTTFEPNKMPLPLVFTVDQDTRQYKNTLTFEYAAIPIANYVVTIYKKIGSSSTILFSTNKTYKGVIEDANIEVGQIYTYTIVLSDPTGAYTLSKLDRVKECERLKVQYVAGTFTKVKASIGDTELSYSFIDINIPSFIVRVIKDNGAEPLYEKETTASDSILDPSITEPGEYSYSLVLVDPNGLFADSTPLDILCTVKSRMVAPVSFTKLIDYNETSIKYAYTIPQQPAAFKVVLKKTDLETGASEYLYQETSALEGVVEDNDPYEDGHEYRMEFFVQEANGGITYDESNALSLSFLAVILQPITVESVTQNDPDPFTLKVVFGPMDHVRTDNVYADFLINNTVVQTVPISELKMTGMYRYSGIALGQHQFTVRLRGLPGSDIIPVIVSIGEFNFTKPMMNSPSTFAITNLEARNTRVSFTYASQFSTNFDIIIKRSGLEIKRYHNLLTASFIDTTAPVGNIIYEIFAVDLDRKFTDSLVASPVTIRERMTPITTVSRRYGVGPNFTKLFFDVVIPTQPLSTFSVIFSKRDVSSGVVETTSISRTNLTLSATFEDFGINVDGHTYEYSFTVKDPRAETFYMDSTPKSITFATSVLPTLIVSGHELNTPLPGNIRFAFSSASELPSESNYYVDTYIDALLVESVLASTIKTTGLYTFKNVDHNPHTFSFVVRDANGIKQASKFTTQELDIDYIDLLYPSAFTISGRDVSFTYASQPTGFATVLYRDGVEVTRWTDILSSSFTDADAPVGAHDYSVVAVPTATGTHNPSKKVIRSKVTDPLTALSSITVSVEGNKNYKFLVALPPQLAQQYQVVLRRELVSSGFVVGPEIVLDCTNTMNEISFVDPFMYTDATQYRIVAYVRDSSIDKLYANSSNITITFTANVITPPTVTVGGAVLPYTYRFDLVNYSVYTNPDYRVDFIVDDVVFETLPMSTVVAQRAYTYSGFASGVHVFKMRIYHVTGQAIETLYTIGSEYFIKEIFPEPSSFLISGLVEHGTRVEAVFTTIYSPDYVLILKRDDLEIARFANVTTFDYLDTDVLIGLHVYEVSVVDTLKRFTTSISYQSVIVKGKLPAPTVFTRVLGSKFTDDHDNYIFTYEVPIQPVEPFRIVFRKTDRELGLVTLKTFDKLNSMRSGSFVDYDSYVSNHSYLFELFTEDTKTSTYYDPSDPIEL